MGFSLPAMPARCPKRNLWEPGYLVDEVQHQLPQNIPGAPGMSADAVKALTIDLGSSVEVVELSGTYGPQMLNIDGGKTYLKHWPKMTSSEKEVMLHMVAKQNRSRREAFQEQVLVETIH